MVLPSHLIDSLTDLVKHADNPDIKVYWEETKRLAELANTQKISEINQSALQNSKWKNTVVFRMYTYIKDVLKIPVEITHDEPSVENSLFSKTIVYKSKENLAHLLFEHSGGGMCEIDSPVCVKIYVLMSEYLAISWWHKSVDKINNDSREFGPEFWIDIKS